MRRQAVHGATISQLQLLRWYLSLYCSSLPWHCADYALPAQGVPMLLVQAILLAHLLRRRVTALLARTHSHVLRRIALVRCCCDPMSHSPRVAASMLRFDVFLMASSRTSRKHNVSKQLACDGRNHSILYTIVIRRTTDALSESGCVIDRDVSSPLPNRTSL